MPDQQFPSLFRPIIAWVKEYVDEQLRNRGIGTRYISGDVIRGGVAPSLHATTHQNGGTDEISVAGLSGVLADKQDADKLQGRAVAATAPTDGQAVVWDNAASTWKPGTVAGGALADHDHSGDAGDGGTFDAANLTSGAAGDGQVLTADGAGGIAWEDPAAPTEYFYVNYIIDGGGEAITTGIKGFVQVPAGTIEAWSILPDQSGSIKIDVWRDTYANYPPEDADSLCNGHEPELSASTKAQDTDLSDWTSVALVEGDILGYNVDSVDTVERVTLSLKVRR